MEVNAITSLTVFFPMNIYIKNIVKYMYQITVHPV